MPAQSYELIGGTVIQRMQSGRAIKQTHFSKLRTTVFSQSPQIQGNFSDVEFSWSLICEEGNWSFNRILKLNSF